MVLAEFGPGVELAKRLRNIEDAVKALSTRDVLQNSSIGINGMTVNGGEIHVTNGGSIVVDGSGTITLPSGAFSSGSVTTSALTVNGDETVTGNTNVSGTVQGGSLVSTGGINASGNVNAAGQVISAGIINSPGTKGNTVTVGYSAVYIDSSGNMGGNTSSRRFKTNIGPAAYDLDAFLALAAYSYQRTSDILEMGASAAPWFDGMMAEDVAPVMPLHVWYDENGQVEGIRFEELVTPLIQAVARERAQRLADRAWFIQSIQTLAAAAGVTLPPPPTN